MNLWQFIFGFLYTRDWHTGEMELSRPRLALFAGMVVILVLAIIFAIILQTPVTYEAT